MYRTGQLFFLIAPHKGEKLGYGKCIQYVRIDFYRKKPSKPLQNTLFYALVSIICGGKPLITTNKLAGPVGKKGVLGGVFQEYEETCLFIKHESLQGDSPRVYPNILKCSLHSLVTKGIQLVGFATRAMVRESPTRVPKIVDLLLFTALPRQLTPPVLDHIRLFLKG